MLPAPRREELLNAARERLAALRAEQRALNEAQLRARIASDRAAAELAVWRGLLADVVALQSDAGESDAGDGDDLDALRRQLDDVAQQTCAAEQALAAERARAERLGLVARAHAERRRLDEEAVALATALQSAQAELAAVEASVATEEQACADIESAAQAIDLLLRESAVADDGDIDAFVNVPSFGTADVLKRAQALRELRLSADGDYESVEAELATARAERDGLAKEIAARKCAAEAARLRTEQQCVSAVLRSTTMHLEDARRDAAQRLTIERIASERVPALQAQVANLSAELARATDDLFLLRDGDDVVRRVQELYHAVASYRQVTVPAQTAALQKAKEEAHARQVACQLWPEEVERHARFSAMLDAEVEKRRASVEELEYRSAAADGAARRHAAAREEWAVLRAQWERLRLEEESAGGGGAAAAASSGGDSRSGSGDSSSGEDNDVEIVGADGAVRRLRLHRPAPQFLSPTRARAAVAAVAAAHHAADGGPARLSPAGRQPTSHGRGGHFRFFAAALVHSLLDMVRGRVVEVPGGGESLSLTV